MYEAGEELDRLVAERMGIELKIVTDAEIGEEIWWSYFDTNTEIANNNINFKWNGTLWTLPISIAEPTDGMFGAYGMMFAYWLKRKGQPWQHDLETHIANYCKPVKPYSTSIADANDLMDWLVREYDVFIETTRYNKFSNSNHPISACRILIGNGGYEEIADTTPLAVCKAFMLIPEEVLWKRKREIQTSRVGKDEAEQA